MLDLDAAQIAAQSGLNRNTIKRYLRGNRERIAGYSKSRLRFSGEIEVDEYYFGAMGIKGKRGCGAVGKAAVFSVFKRNGHVYTENIQDCK